MEVEGLFGLVNDSIRRLATEAPEHEKWDFFCECPDLACHELVKLTIVEFDTLRTAQPRIPILASHDA
jgi:hypothetical protein